MKKKQKRGAWNEDKNFGVFYKPYNHKIVLKNRKTNSMTLYRKKLSMNLFWRKIVYDIVFTSSICPRSLSTHFVTL